ncbi:DUF6804 family protein [Marisediminicola sp. LYQ134]|uniref:DUF6804 family protein n=1 Tax=unclassified Marisediminicola TaxID=2618316 RepID=UPI00398301F0
MTTYPTPEFRRTALPPSILASIVLIAGILLLGTGGFVWILYAVSILALIVLVFTWQARQWWWIPVLAAIAVAWNPVVVFDFSGPVWLGAQFLAALLFVIIGSTVKVANPDAPRRRSPG